MDFQNRKKYWEFSRVKEVGDLEYRKRRSSFNFMFVFPYIITLYYIKNQLDATLAVMFISNCKITLHVSDALCVHHQEY